MVARYGEFPTFPCLRAILQKPERQPLLSLLLLLLVMMIGLVFF